MKKVLILITVAMFSINLFASQEQCEELNYQAETVCLEDICGDSISSCHQDGDFFVWMQECSYEERNELVGKYNQENPTTKIDCDDFDYERGY